MAVDKKVLNAISDDLAMLEIYLDRARTMVSDAIEGYYDRLDPDNARDRDLIAIGFIRRRTYMDITNDYLRQMSEQMESTQERLNQELSNGCSKT